MADASLLRMRPCTLSFELCRRRGNRLTVAEMARSARYGMGESSDEDLESSEGEDDFEKGILRIGRTFSAVFERIFQKVND